MELELTLDGHTDQVRSIKISHDFGKLFSSSEDNTIKIWSIRTGECLATLKGHEGPVFDIALISDSKIATASFDKSVKIWDVEKEECIKTLQDFKEDDAYDRRISKVSYLKAKNHLVAGFLDGSVTVWDLSNYHKVKSFIAHHTNREQASL
jgi:WD40 repeat protein